MQQLFKLLNFPTESTNPTRQCPTMVLLIGYLAVGKSTIIKQYESKGYSVLAVDQLIEKDPAYRIEIKQTTSQSQGTQIYRRYRALYKAAYKNQVETIARKKSVIIESLGKESSVKQYSQLAYNIGAIFKIHYLHLSDSIIIINRIKERNEKQHRQTQVRQEQMNQYLKRTPIDILGYLEKFPIAQIVITKSKLGLEESGASSIMKKLIRSISGQQ